MDKLYAYRGWILGALAIALLATPGMEISEAWYEPLAVSIACLVAFALLRVQARRSIGEHTRGFTHDADRLVTEGIYSRIRHPLYLSNAGIGYAFIVLHLGFSLTAIPFVVVLLAFEFLLSRMEDRYLENRFQDEWRRWAAWTPAFFPRVLGNRSEPSGSGESRHEHSGSVRSFGAAFVADGSTWFWLVVAVLLIMARKLI